MLTKGLMKWEFSIVAGVVIRDSRRHMTSYHHSHDVDSISRVRDLWNLLQVRLDTPMNRRGSQKGFQGLIGPARGTVSFLNGKVYLWLSRSTLDPEKGLCIPTEALASMPSSM